MKQNSQPAQSTSANRHGSDDSDEEQLEEVMRALAAATL